MQSQVGKATSCLEQQLQRKWQHKRKWHRGMCNAKSWPQWFEYVLWVITETSGKLWKDVDILGQDLHCRSTAAEITGDHTWSCYLGLSYAWRHTLKHHLRWFHGTKDLLGPSKGKSTLVDATDRCSHKTEGEKKMLATWNKNSKGHSVQQGSKISPRGEVYRPTLWGAHPLGFSKTSPQCSNALWLSPDFLRIHFQRAIDISESK